MKGSKVFLRFLVLFNVMLFFLVSPSVRAAISFPTYDPLTGENNWNGWTKITLPHAYQIGANSSIWLGLNNSQVLTKTKTVTLEYNAGSIIANDFVAGYQDNHTVSWSMEIIDSTTTYRKWEGTINPQPSWECIKLTNTTTSVQSISIVSLSSICNPNPVPVPWDVYIVPEPATICLIGFGGLLLRHKRK